MTPTTAASHEQEVVVPVACGHLRPANRDLGGENPDGRRLRRQIEGGEPLEFGHTLEDQIGGQIAAGFVITGFYEDRHSDDPIAAHPDRHAGDETVTAPSGLLRKLQLASRIEIAAGARKQMLITPEPH